MEHLLCEWLFLRLRLTGRGHFDQNLALSREEFIETEPVDASSTFLKRMMKDLVDGSANAVYHVTSLFFCCCYNALQSRSMKRRRPWQRGFVLSGWLQWRLSFGRSRDVKRCERERLEVLWTCGQSATYSLSWTLALSSTNIHNVMIIKEKM